MKRWPTKPLGELVDFVGGGTPRRDRPDYWGGEIPWASVKDLQSQSLETTLENITAKGLANSASNLIPQGTVIIASRVGLGKVAINLKPVAINQDLKALTPRSSDLSPRYLLLFLLSKAEYFERAGVGATVKGLTLADYQKLDIVSPPLAVQEQIVKLLDEADELRKLRAQAGHRTADLIPALFHDMFGDPEHTRFSVKPLIALVVEERPITYGILKPGPDVEGGIPYVRVLDIKQSRLHVEQLHKTTKEIASQYRRSMIRPGDILVTIRGTVGRTCIVPDELTGANITQDTARLATIPSIEPVYVVEFLNTPWAQGWMNHHTQGQAVKGINLGDLKKLPVPVPSFALQKEFAARVSEIRTLQAEQAASRRRLDDLFQSMLHRAFKGKL